MYIDKVLFLNFYPNPLKILWLLPRASPSIILSNSDLLTDQVILLKSGANETTPFWRETWRRELTWANDHEYKEPEKHRANRIVLCLFGGSFRHISPPCNVLFKPVNLPICKTPWSCLYKKPNPNQKPKWWGKNMFDEQLFRL